MTNVKKEKLSAFLDNEFDGNSAELVQQLGTDPELQATWNRYQMISDCLKQGLLGGYVDNQLPLRVAQALEREPVLLHPAARPRNNFIKPLAGFAIAASVAAVAILGIQQPVDKQLQQPEPRNIATLSSPLAGSVSTVPVRQVSSDINNRRMREITANERLNRYLVNYDELRNGTGVQGIRPHVRVVAHDNQ